jgi:hypothetical protein
VWPTKRTTQYACWMWAKKDLHAVCAKKTVNNYKKLKLKKSRQAYLLSERFLLQVNVLYISEVKNETFYRLSLQSTVQGHRTIEVSSSASSPFIGNTVDQTRQKVLFYVSLISFLLKFTALYLRNCPITLLAFPTTLSARLLSCSFYLFRFTIFSFTFSLSKFPSSPLVLVLVLLSMNPKRLLFKVWKKDDALVHHVGKSELFTHSWKFERKMALRITMWVKQNYIHIVESLKERWRSGSPCG